MAGTEINISTNEIHQAICEYVEKKYKNVTVISTAIDVSYDGFFGRVDVNGAIVKVELSTK